MQKIHNYNEEPYVTFKREFRTAQGSDPMASAEREPMTGIWGRRH